MKTLLASILLLLPFNEDGRGLIMKEDLVMLVIDQQTTEEELNAYKTRLKKERNITLSYDLTFDHKNKLREISLMVDCNDGFKGSLIRTLRKKDKIGFYRIFEEGYETPFMVGNLPGIYDLK